MKKPSEVEGGWQPVRLGYRANDFVHRPPKTLTRSPTLRRRAMSRLLQVADTLPSVTTTLTVVKVRESYFRGLAALRKRRELQLLVGGAAA